MTNDSTTDRFSVAVSDDQGTLQADADASPKSARSIAAYYLGDWAAESLVATALDEGSAEGQRGRYIVRLAALGARALTPTFAPTSARTSGAPITVDVVSPLRSTSAGPGDLSGARVIVTPLADGGVLLTASEGYREGAADDEGDWIADTTVWDIALPAEAWRLISGRPF